MEREYSNWLFNYARLHQCKELLRMEKIKKYLMKKIDDLLEEMGLYQRDWLGYDSVIKLKSNDYTILIKHYGYWEWYNEEDFNLIKCDEQLKEELKSILKPKNGYFEKK
jgi:hypothetical protein